METKKNKSEFDKLNERITYLNKSIVSYDDEIEELHIKKNKLTLDIELIKHEMDQIFNNSMNATWIINSEYIIKRVNDKMKTLLGKPDSEIIEKKCFNLLNNSFCKTKNCPLIKLKKTNKKIESETIININKKQFVFNLSVTTFNGVSSEFLGVIMTYTDITIKKHLEKKLKSAYKELEKLSMTDGLTKIANRRNFDITFDKEIKRAKRDKEHLALIMIDIDFFKFYNDHHGHIEGDKCLIQVASIISSVTNRASDLVARYGGEEFVIILPYTTEAGAKKIATQLKEKMRENNIVHRSSKVKPYVTLSMGVFSAIPDNYLLPENMIKIADKALYEAKENGRNQYKYSSQ